MEQLSIFDLGIESYVYTLDKETISKLFISANGGGTIHKIKIEYLERI